MTISNVTRSLLTHRLLRSAFLQPLWERIHFWTLFWMNHGAGGDCHQSGEEHFLSLYSRACPGKQVVFDVGANRGEYAALVRRILPESQVYCFEPVLATVEALRANISRLGSVEVIPIALSDQAGTAQIYSYTFNQRDADQLASLDLRLPTQTGSIEVSGIEEVGLDTVDNFCAQRGIASIDLLKIDVEGHDLAVLKGASRKISSGAVGVIQFEFGPANLYSRTTFYDFWSLLSERYQIFRILPSAIRRIDHYEEWREVYLTTNYIAVRHDLVASLT